MPGVTRQGDITTGHAPCFPPRPPTSWSPNVFCNDLPVIRVTDTYAPHATPPCIPHDGFLSVGSPNVFCNDLQLGRIGDPVSCGDYVAIGSTNVIAN